MKQSVYLDTTIPSYYYDGRDELRNFVEMTRQWWDEESGNYEVYISEYTQAELSRGVYPCKEDVPRLLDGIPCFPWDDEVDTIAEVYIKECVMPAGAAGDAFHFGCASYNKVDYLLTWNCNHLANANKDRRIRVINTKLDLCTPKIVTPLQLFSEKE